MGTVSFNFKTDMDNIFLDSGFEESITYTVDGGAAKTINAIVDRDRIDETVEGRHRMNQYKTIITISKTDIPSVTVQGDQVSLSKNNGTETFRVGGVLEEDQGSFTLGLI